MTIACSKLIHILYRLLAIIFLSLCSNISFANDYSIQNIFVKEESESASEARNIAILKANREGFLRLLKNIKVKDLSIDEISDDEIESLILSKQILNEKIANNWYYAKFNINFSEDAVKNILEEKKNFNANLHSKKYLLFPIELSKNKINIWHNNLWFDFLLKILKKNPNEDIIIPDGNIDDISILFLDDISRIKYSDFVPILKKYNSDIAILSYVNFDDLENKAMINLLIIKQFTIKKVKLNFVNIKNLSKNELLSIIAKKVIEYLVSKKESIDKSVVKQFITKSDKNNIKIDILTSDIENWIKLKSKLDNMSYITNIDIISISSKMIKISINYQDDLNIIEYLLSKNIAITEMDNNYFLSLD